MRPRFSSGLLTSSSGFGVDEFPLPAGANISVLNALSRHGSRYPTSNSSQQSFGMTIQGLTSKGVNFTGALSFLNTWTYKLGSEILIPRGNQELVSLQCKWHCITHIEIDYLTTVSCTTLITVIFTSRTPP